MLGVLNIPTSSASFSSNLSFPQPLVSFPSRMFCSIPSGLDWSLRFLKLNRLTSIPPLAFFNTNRNTKEPLGIKRSLDVEEKKKHNNYVQLTNLINKHQEISGKGTTKLFE